MIKLFVSQPSADNKVARSARHWASFMSEADARIFAERATLAYPTWRIMIPELGLTIDPREECTL